MMIINYLAEIFATFTEFFIFLCFLSFFFEQKFSKKPHFVLRFVVATIVTVFVFLMNSIEIFSFSTAYTWLFIAILAGVFLFKANIIHIASSSITYTLLIVLVDIAVFTVYEFILGFKGSTFVILTEMGLPRIILVVSVKMFLICLCVISMKVLKGKKMSFSTGGWISIGVYSLFSFVSVSDLFEAIITKNVEQMQKSVLLATLFMTLGIIGLFLILQIKDRLHREKYESSIIQSQIEILENDNRQLNSAHQEIAKISHDFKSHLRTIADLADIGNQDELRAYLNELSEDLQSAESVSYTGIESIDTVISRKILQAKNADIVANVTASYINSGIRNIDVCVVLSNLFDNALEACEKVADKEKRFVNCSISGVGKMTVIKIENSYDADVSIFLRDGSIATTKKNADIHGLGLKIVRSIVEKYNGTLETKYENGIFSVYILLNN